MLDTDKYNLEDQQILQTILAMISTNLRSEGFHSSCVEDSSLLGCDTMSLG